MAPQAGLFKINLAAGFEVLQITLDGFARNSRAGEFYAPHALRAALRQLVVNAGPRIVVIGSLNVDLTLRVAKLPAPGESVIAQERFTCFGGKGANQAVAAARAGGNVSMIGCVGEDEPGDRYLAHLRAEGIDESGVRVLPGSSTGAAYISVDDAGENTIVVQPGANGEVTASQFEGQGSLFEEVDAVLLQLECPLPAVASAIEMAKFQGTTVVLNPSPWREQAREVCGQADVLIVNQSEASALAAGDDIENLTALRQKIGCGALIVTRGARSIRVAAGVGELFEVDPPMVSPVDTVGAGDTFAGFLAVAWAEGQSLEGSVRVASIAAAMATLKPGAQEAIPNREDLCGGSA